MAQEHINVDFVNGQPELYIDTMQAKFGDLMPEQMDASLLQHERDVEQLVASFPEHDTRAEAMQPLMQYIEAHPEQYQQLMHDYNDVWTQVGAVATLDEAGKATISHLANSLIAQNHQILQQFTTLAANAGSDAEANAATEAVFGNMLDETMQANLTPQHIYFFECAGALADQMRDEQI